MKVCFSTINRVNSTCMGLPTSFLHWRYDNGFSPWGVDRAAQASFRYLQQVIRARWLCHIWNQCSVKQKYGKVLLSKLIPHSHDVALTFLAQFTRSSALARTYSALLLGFWKGELGLRGRSATPEDSCVETSVLFLRKGTSCVHSVLGGAVCAVCRAAAEVGDSLAMRRRDESSRIPRKQRRQLNALVYTSTFCSGRCHFAYIFNMHRTLLEGSQPNLAWLFLNWAGSTGAVHTLNNNGYHISRFKNLVQYRHAKYWSVIEVYLSISIHWKRRHLIWCYMSVAWNKYQIRLCVIQDIASPASYIFEHQNLCQLVWPRGWFRYFYLYMRAVAGT